MIRTLLHDLFHWHKWESIGQVKHYVPLIFVHDVRECQLCGTCESGTLWWHYMGWESGTYYPIEKSEVDQYLNDKRELEAKRGREMREHEKNSIRHVLKVLRKYSE